MHRRVRDTKKLGLRNLVAISWAARCRLLRSSTDIACQAADPSSMRPSFACTPQQPASLRNSLRYSRTACVTPGQPASPGNSLRQSGQPALLPNSLTQSGAACVTQEQPASLWTACVTSGQPASIQNSLRHSGTSLRHSGTAGYNSGPPCNTSEQAASLYSPQNHSVRIPNIPPLQPWQITYQVCKKLKDPTAQHAPSGLHARAQA